MISSFWHQLIGGLFLGFIFQAIAVEMGRGLFCLKDQGVSFNLRGHVCGVIVWILFLVCANPGGDSGESSVFLYLSYAVGALLGGTVEEVVFWHQRRIGRD